MAKRIVFSACCIVVAAGSTAQTGTAGTLYNRPTANSSEVVYVTPQSLAKPAKPRRAETQRREDETATVAPRVAPISFAPSWTGPYLGLTIGAGWMNSKLNVPTVGSFSGVGLYGASIGVTGGFDYQFGRWLVAGLAVDGYANSVQAKDSIVGTGDVTYRETATWALRGRIGFSASDDTLIYASGGMAQTRTSLEFPVALGMTGGGATYSGLVLGGGIETRLEGNLYGRVEYLHGFYGQKSFFNGLYSARPTTGALKFGLVWKPSGSTAVADGVAVPVRESWTGAYGGLYGGWAWSNTRLSSSNFFSADGIGGNGAMAGMFLGYDYQLGRSVAGIEVDFGRSSSAATLDGNPGASFGGRVAYDMTYGVRARFGQVFGNTMLFAALGAAGAHGRLNSYGLGISDASHTFIGVQLGGGAETMLTENIAARIEYLHTMYATFSSINGSTTDVGLTTGKTRAAMIYKF